MTFDGRRFDCGGKLGFVEATLALALALEREDMGAEMRAMAERLLAKPSSSLPPAGEIRRLGSEAI